MEVETEGWLRRSLGKGGNGGWCARPDAGGRARGVKSATKCSLATRWAKRKRQYVSASVTTPMPIQRTRLMSSVPSNASNRQLFSTVVHRCATSSTMKRIPIGSSSVPSPRLNSSERCDEKAHEEEEKTSEVGRHRPAAPCRQRELDRCCSERVRQRDEGVGREIGRGPERTNRVGMHAGRVARQQDAGLHGEQDQRVQNERGEKSPAEVLGLADGAV